MGIGVGGGDYYDGNDDARQRDDLSAENRKLRDRIKTMHSEINDAVLSPKELTGNLLEILHRWSVADV